MKEINNMSKFSVKVIATEEELAKISLLGEVKTGDTLEVTERDGTYDFKNELGTWSIYPEMCEKIYILSDDEKECIIDSLEYHLEGCAGNLDGSDNDYMKLLKATMEKLQC
jgi:hypothetical protein